MFSSPPDQQRAENIYQHVYMKSVGSSSTTQSYAELKQPDEMTSTADAHHQGDGRYGDSYDDIHEYLEITSWCHSITATDLYRPPHSVLLTVECTVRL